MSARHGRATLGESVLVGMIEADEDGVSHYIEVDGERGSNGRVREFFADWTVTYDPDPLPSKVGAIIQIERQRYVQVEHGRWMRLGYWNDIWSDSDITIPFTVLFDGVEE